MLYALGIDPALSAWELDPDIARRQVWSEHTVHWHLANILRKLGLSSRAAAAAWGVRTGLV